MSTSSKSEWTTRKKRINPQLAASGWLVETFDPHNPPVVCTRHAFTEFPTNNGPADYAMFGDGQPLGVVEAKKITLGPQNVLTQAERYARGFTDLHFQGRSSGLIPYKLAFWPLHAVSVGDRLQ